MMDSHPDSYPPPPRDPRPVQRQPQPRRGSGDTHQAIYYRDSQLRLNRNAVTNNNAQDNTQEEGDGAAEDHNNTLAAMREMRISEGLCPTCGVQLYKKEKTKKKKKKLLPSRKNKSEENNNDDSHNNNNNNAPRMIPLDVAGVVARGQCIRCTSGDGEAAIMASVHTYSGPIVGPSAIVSSGSGSGSGGGGGGGVVRNSVTSNADVASVTTAIAQPDLANDGIYRPTAAVMPCPPGASSTRRRAQTPTPPPPQAPTPPPPHPPQLQERAGVNRPLVCPEGMDPDTFAALPPDLQRELVADYEAEQQLLHPTSAPTTTTPTPRSTPSTNPPPPSGPRFQTRPPATTEGTTDAPSINANEVVATPVVRSETDNNNTRVFPAPPSPPREQVFIGCTYEGAFNENHQRHGQGTLKWQNGDVYKGSFYNNKRQGNGTIAFADGTEYVGVWEDDLMHGEGTRRFPNGDVYTGCYIYGKRSGQGRCYFANGDMYVGEFRNDTIYGHGRYYYNNGNSFEGNFFGGKRHGRGKYQYNDGHIEIFRYYEDERVGEGVRWSKDRKKAWRLKENGKVKGKVGIEEAARIADECGPLREPI